MDSRPPVDDPERHRVPIQTSEYDPVLRFASGVIQWSCFLATGYFITTLKEPVAYRPSFFRPVAWMKRNPALLLKNSVGTLKIRDTIKAISWIETCAASGSMMDKNSLAAWDERSANLNLQYCHASS